MADHTPATADVTTTPGGLTASGASARRRVEDTEYSETQFKELQALYEKTLGKISEGEIVRGRIVAIGENDVSIDIGFKSEGTVALDEFTNKDDPEGRRRDRGLPRERREQGRPAGPVSQARRLHAHLGTCHQVVRDRRSAAGSVRPPHQGRSVVDLMGIDAFLPGSQIDVRPVRDFDAYHRQGSWTSVS